MEEHERVSAKCAPRTSALLAVSPTLFEKANGPMEYARTVRPKEKDE